MKWCRGFVLSCVVILASSQAIALNPGIYSVKGVVQNSVSSGGGICLVTGSKAKGYGFYDNKSVPLIPPGLVVGLKGGRKVHEVVYILGSKYDTISNQKLHYVLPPKAQELKGSFSLTPVNGHQFTLETKTGSLGKSAGNCDTTYALSFKSGISVHLDRLF